MKDSIAESIQQIANHTIPRYAWWSLCITYVLVAFLLIWAIFGRIDLNIEGEGIVLNSKGLFSIESPISGTIRNLSISPKDFIRKGELLAEVYNADDEQRLSSIHIQIKALKREVGRLKHQISIETKTLKRSLKQQILSLENTVQLLREEQSFLQAQYEKKKTLYEEGLLTIGMIQEANRSIQMTEISIKEMQSKILSVEAKLMASYRTEELKNKEFELQKTQQEAHILSAKLSQSKIYSPYEGRVIELLVNRGDIVKEGQSLIHAEREDPQNEWTFYGYFPVEVGKLAKQGDTMNFHPSTVNEKEYGGILSQVSEISTYPLSRQFLANRLSNDYLAAFLTNEKPTFEVKAIPLKDRNDPSGYYWTSRAGPLNPFSSGEVGKVEITVDSISPSSYLFPHHEISP